MFFFSCRIDSPLFSINRENLCVSKTHVFTQQQRTSLASEWRERANQWPRRPNHISSAFHYYYVHSLSSRLLFFFYLTRVNSYNSDDCQPFCKNQSQFGAIWSVLFQQANDTALAQRISAPIYSPTNAAWIIHFPSLNSTKKPNQYSQGIAVDTPSVAMYIPNFLRHTPKNQQWTRSGTD